MTARTTFISLAACSVLAGCLPKDFTGYKELADSDLASLPLNVPARVYTTYDGLPGRMVVDGFNANGCVEILSHAAAKTDTGLNGAGCDAPFMKDAIVYDMERRKFLIKEAAFSRTAWEPRAR